MYSFWRSGNDYDIESESSHLKKYGEPFIVKSLKSEHLNSRRPLLVDFGCWSGRHLQLLERVAEKADPSRADVKDRVIGIDEPFAKERLDEARRAHRGFTILDKGIAKTGLPSSSVDAAISWRVLHNLTVPGEWTNALMEIRRVLKHGAPFVVAIRSTRPWMQQDAPVPLLYRSYSAGVDRDDLYFSKKACGEMFKMYGFKIPFEPLLFTEGEVVNGERRLNDYWLLRLICNKH